MAAEDICRVETLTDDALLVVFSYLTVWDKGRAACVCRRWRGLMQTDSIWKTIVVEKPEKSDVCTTKSLGLQSKVETLFHTYARRTTTCIYTQCVNNNILDVINRKCRLLLDLHLVFNKKDGLGSLTFGNKLRNLSLDVLDEQQGLFDCPVPLFDILADNKEGFHNLQSLSLVYFDLELSELSVRHLSCSKVFTCLDFMGCSLLKNDIMNLVTEIAPTLTKLSFRNCKFNSSQSFAMLIQHCGQTCRNLEKIHISDVEFEVFGNLYDDEIEEIKIAITTLSNNRNLQSLSLGGKDLTLDVAGMRLMASCVQELKELTLEECNGLTDDVLLIIGSSFTKLKYLELTYLYDITDRGILGLSHHPGLQELEIAYYSSAVTSSAMVRTICSLPKLDKIRISRPIGDSEETNINIEEKIKMLKPNLTVNVKVT